MNNQQLFNTFYVKKETQSFGLTPTKGLTDLVSKIPSNGKVLDIACGDGRDSIFFLKQGFGLNALDFSKKGLEKLANYAVQHQFAEQLVTIQSDFTTWDYPTEQFDLVSSVTGLDHIEHQFIEPTLDRFVQALKTGGYLFLQVHTEEDPGCEDANSSNASELATAIKSYFKVNELLKLVQAKGIRILSYEEVMEDDFNHGEPHQHGFAYLVGQKI
jgi:SAM-dependent methyltransferase